MVAFFVSEQVRTTTRKRKMRSEATTELVGSRAWPVGALVLSDDVDHAVPGRTQIMALVLNAGVPAYVFRPVADAGSHCATPSFRMR